MAAMQCSLRVYWRALARFTIFMHLDGMLSSYFCYEYKFNDLSNNINFVPQILIFLIYLVKVVFLRKRNDSYSGTKGYFLVPSINKILHITEHFFHLYNQTE